MHPHDQHTAAEGAASASASDELQQARRLLAADEQGRMEACAAEIDQVLARYGMRLEVTPAQITLTIGEARP